MTIEQKPIDVFHSHLDLCRRCRDEPFNLCRVGSTLLAKAATDLGDSMRANLEVAMEAKSGER